MYLGEYLFMKDTKIECYLSFVARQALTSCINLWNGERAYTAPDPESSKMNSFCEETLGLIFDVFALMLHTPSLATKNQHSKFMLKETT